MMIRFIIWIDSLLFQMITFEQCGIQFQETINNLTIDSWGFPIDK